MINPSAIQFDDLPEEFREVADAIGLKAALDLVEKMPGCQLYVPKLETITRKQKYRQMYDDFTVSGSYKQVAVKHSLSESHTRQIIKEEKQRRFPPQAVEVSLF